MIAGGLFAAPRAHATQPAGRVPRVAFLYFGSRRSALETGRYGAFITGMRELGYVQGKTVILHERFADGQSEHLPSLIEEVLGLGPDVIVATGTPVYSTLKRAPAAVPIVITVTADRSAKASRRVWPDPAGTSCSTVR